MLRHLKFRIDEESIKASSSEVPLEEPTQSTYRTDLKEIDTFLNKQPHLNGINQYVAALIKIQLNQTQDAIDLLVKCLNQIPLFWSAWVELLRLISESDKQPFPFLNKIHNNWAKNFYILSLFIDNVRLSEKIEKLCYEMSSGLLHFFPESTFLKNCLAMFFHNLSDYDNSLEMFYQVLSVDPFRFENMDILSNILYVKEKHNELGKLAIRCFEIDKYSPETCCVLGNYYSLVGEHTQAAAQFQRAIQLDKHFLAGYTLLGKKRIYDYLLRIHKIKLPKTFNPYPNLRPRVPRAQEPGLSHRGLQLCAARQQEGLPGLVRPGPGLRAPEPAALCHLLLSADPFVQPQRLENVECHRHLLRENGLLRRGRKMFQAGWIS